MDNQEVSNMANTESNYVEQFANGELTFEEYQVKLNEQYRKQRVKRVLELLSDCGLSEEHQKSVTPEIIEALDYLCKQFDELQAEVDEWRAWINDRPYGY